MPTKRDWCSPQLFHRNWLSVCLSRATSLTSLGCDTFSSRLIKLSSNFSVWSACLMRHFHFLLFDGMWQRWKAEWQKPIHLFTINRVLSLSLFVGIHLLRRILEDIQQQSKIYNSVVDGLGRTHAGEWGNKRQNHHQPIVNGYVSCTGTWQQCTVTRLLFIWYNSGAGHWAASKAEFVFLSRRRRLSHLDVWSGYDGRQANELMRGICVDIAMEAWTKSTRRVLVCMAVSRPNVYHVSASAHEMHVIQSKHYHDTSAFELNKVDVDVDDDDPMQCERKHELSKNVRNGRWEKRQHRQVRNLAYQLLWCRRMDDEEHLSLDWVW